MSMNSDMEGNKDAQSTGNIQEDAALWFSQAGTHTRRSPSHPEQTSFSDFNQLKSRKSEAVILAPCKLQLNLATVKISGPLPRARNVKWLTALVVITTALTLIHLR